MKKLKIGQTFTIKWIDHFTITDFNKYTKMYII